MFITYIKNGKELHMRRYAKEEFMKYSKHLYIGSSEESYRELPHTHDFIELVYVLSGKSHQIINGTHYDLYGGDILFMNFGCTHEFYSSEGFYYINILFSPELVSSRIVDPESAFSLFSLTLFNELSQDSCFGRLSLVGEERREVEQIIFAMQREYTEKRSSWETVIGNYFNTLVIKLLRISNADLDKKELDGIWHEVSDYIEKHLDTKLTLSDVAKKCFYNPSYFSRIFKERFGMTLSAYITKSRVERAKTLLSETGLSVAKIAFAVGFGDIKSFYHAFSLELGTTPAKYRDSIKSKKSP